MKSTQNQPHTPTTACRWLAIAGFPALLTLGLLLSAFFLQPETAQANDADSHSRPERLVEATSLAFPEGTAHRAEVSDILMTQATQVGEPVAFLAILTEQANISALATPVNSAATSPEWLARRTAIYQELTTTALAAQAPLRAWLDAEGISYQPFYLLNMLAIEGDAALIEQLRNRPDIARLVANPLLDEGSSLGASTNIITEKKLPVENNLEANALSPAVVPFPEPIAEPAQMPENSQTGIEFTRAPLVWEMGFRGQGLVVASGDTGIEWDHPSLRPKYRGWNAETQTVEHDYHWLDAWRNHDKSSVSPTVCAFVEGACDDWGHGTHTMGTMVGDPDPAGPTLIGMAPDAQWIACRNMRANFGTPAKYTECFQFFLAPYPPDGDPFTDGNPALGAHIINNSWGCPPSEGCDINSLRDVVETMQTAGIFVVASAGNSGPECSTVRTPPGHHAATFSVGAHSLGGGIASFSSRGPVTADGSGRLKPELVAPGVSIYSTHRNGNYASLSGTSMAAPHVAGAVALLWSAVPALQGNVALTTEILVKSATPVLDNRCDGDRPPISPNNTYGYGRLDAYRAVLMARSPWTVGIQVRAPGGTPLANVAVELEDERTGQVYTAITTADGWARWTTIYDGQYVCRIDLSPLELGSTGISRSPAAAFPTGSEGSLTVATCQPTQPLPPLDSRLYVPSVMLKPEADTE